MYSIDRQIICHPASFTAVLLAFVVTLSGCSFLRPHGLADRSLWRSGWDGFRAADASAEQMGLTMQGGYQQGKIPVVFVHGLLSNHRTWEEVIDSLSNNPDFREHYQVWTYTYPTGPSYLVSATDLRERLDLARSECDPQFADKALDHMVLIGHSMGGLLSKLQVTHSEGVLWSAISDHPFSAVSLPPDDLKELADHVFFEPSPSIKRVVFIATPHGGSRWTERPLGKLGRRLVEFPEEMRADFQRVVPANASLLREIPKRIPTSVDHLCPSCPEILATQELRFADNVICHSIIGVGYRLPDLSKGDGVVSVESAQIPQAASELFVRSPHTQLHRAESSLAELERILVEHLGTFHSTVQR